MKKIAIIGAGFSGAVAAFLLKDSHHLVLFEKARSVGGRLCSRYHADFEFDFGCPFFKIQHPLFQDFAQRFDLEMFLSGEYVAKPRMNTMIKQLLHGLELHLQTKVTRLDDCGQELALYADDCFLGQFDFCISSLPPQQSLTLLHDKRLSQYPLHGQWVLMLGLHTHWQDKVCYPQQYGIEKIVANHLKPSRSGQTSLVVYMNYSWSQQHIEDSSEAIETALLPILQTILSLQTTDIAFIQAHRWRYAQHHQQFEQGFIWDEQNKWAAIGDAYLNADLESAFLSAYRLSEKLKRLV